jgi:uncharacterized protein (TIGR03437 family)
MKSRIWLFVLAFFISVTSSLGQIVSSGPLNAASFTLAMPSGGALATVFIFGAIGTPGILIAPSSLPLPFELGGIRVTVNGAAAPILAVVIPPAGSSSAGQINFQVPLERNATLSQSGAGVGGTMVVSQTGNGEFTLSLSGIGVGEYYGSFFADANRFAIARHASDQSLITVQQPARPGETIIVYGNDFFPVWPPPPIGIAVPQSPLFPFYSGGYVQNLPAFYLGSFPGLQVTGRSPALQVLSARLAPNMVGVEQLEIVIPANQAPGDWALFSARGCPQQLITCVESTSPYVLLPVR